VKADGAARKTTWRAISALLSGGAVPPAKTRRPQWPRAARRLRPWFPWGRVRSGPPV